MRRQRIENLLGKTENAKGVRKSGIDAEIGTNTNDRRPLT
jgi:hypothetical protein